LNKGVLCVGCEHPFFFKVDEFVKSRPHEFFDTYIWVMSLFFLNKLRLEVVLEIFCETIKVEYEKK